MLLLLLPLFAVYDMLLFLDGYCYSMIRLLTVLADVLCEDLQVRKFELGVFFCLVQLMHEHPVFLLNCCFLCNK